MRFCQTTTSVLSLVGAVLLATPTSAVFGQACPAITDPQPLNSNAGSDSGDDGAHFGGPQLTTDGAGNWVAVWESNEDLGGAIGIDADILFSRSTDNGITWTAPLPLNTNAASDDGFDQKPQLTTDRAGLWIAVWRSNSDLDGTVGADFDILFSLSVDNGLSWAAPAPLNTNAGFDSGGDSLPQLTTDGMGVWIAVWISNNELDEGLGIDDDILFARSTDNGTTWSDPLPLNTNAVGFGGADLMPQLTTDGAGNWLAIWASKETLEGTIGNDFDILFATSTDDGESWTDPQALNTNAAVDSEDDAWPQLTTDSSGNWVAVWASNDDLGGTIGTDRDILFARSTDNGANWTAPEPLNTNAASDGSFDLRPELTTDGVDHWVAVWASGEDLDESIGPDVDILFSGSTDNGATWTDPLPLNTNATSDSGDDRFPQLTTNAVGNWVAVWWSDDDLDGTIDTDRDILFALFQLTADDCNGNGTPDECDVADGSSDDLDGDGVPDECALMLDVDIKPGSCPNPFNRHSNGVLPVALIGTGEFDPTEVDLSSLQLSRADGVGGSLGPNEGPPGPHSVFEDVGSPFEGAPCECHDLGGDGIDDLSMKFRTDELVEALELDALPGGAVVELMLNGSLLDGTPFTASDCIVILPPGDVSPANAHVESTAADTFIEVVPLDLNFDDDGFADFSRSYYNGTAVTLTAPPQSAGRRFVRWLVDGVPQPMGMRTIEVTVNEDTTLKAAYARPARATPVHPTESDDPLE